MPAVDSPAGVPVKSPSIGLGHGYKDPTRFRYSPFPRPSVDSCPPVTFATSTILKDFVRLYTINKFILVPSTVESWFISKTGRSEYQDSISKVGLSIIKSRQQYAEPLPSSRRRFAESNL